MATVSVVVPVYNAEAYLDACVQSILAQSHADFELILVDDGSPDSCPAMCDAWAGRDARIRVVHKPNGGLSSARNAGMRVAKGDWLCFVDADDAVAPDMLRLAVDALTVNNADVASFGILERWPDGRTRTVTMPSFFANTMQAFAPYAGDYLMRVGLLGSACNKLYRRALLTKRGILFDEDIPISEDEPFVCQVYACAAGLVHLEACLYYYNQHNTASITRRGSTQVYAACVRNEPWMLAFLEVAGLQALQGECLRQRRLHAVQNQFDQLVVVNSLGFTQRWRALRMLCGEPTHRGWLRAYLLGQPGPAAGFARACLALRAYACLAIVAAVRSWVVRRLVWHR